MIDPPVNRRTHINVQYPHQNGTWKSESTMKMLQVGSTDVGSSLIIMYATYGKGGVDFKPETKVHQFNA